VAKTQKANLNLKKTYKLFTRVCVHVHNCCTKYSTEQFWQSSRWPSSRCL